ncbi:MAG: zinc-binding dehydrogenase [Candidatus Sumerlaeaceae bacterium]|nr:zinc-binding dehydrogenase [Candidatus Sumerlaeaceae bacterium]
MKALVVDIPGRLVLADMPRPVPGDYDALVRTEVCGICNSTDKRVIDGTMCFHSQYPAILGHEGVGVVVETGRRVRSLRPGMRITRPFAVLPGECRNGLWSAWGGFAEYGLARDRLALADDGYHTEASHFLVQRQNLVPQGLDPVDAALAISMAEITSFLDKLGTLDGKIMVILGTGIAGLAMADIAKRLGARRTIVLGRRPERLWQARACGADEAFLSDPSQIPAVREATGGLGADWLIEAVGDPEALVSWLGCLRPGGGVAVYGLSDHHAYNLPLRAAPGDFHFHVPAPEDQRTYHWVCDLMLSGALNPRLFRSHLWRWPDEVLAAFDAVRRREVLKGFVVFP